MEREALWKQFIKGKYEEVEGGWCSKEVCDGYGVGLWKAMRKLWAMFNTKVSFCVANGRRVKFWKGRWCGNDLLCESFPSLFALASSKEVWVAESV